MKLDTVETIKLSGEFRCFIRDSAGRRRRGYRARNSVNDNYKNAIASAIAQQTSGVPAYMAIGTGCPAANSNDYAPANRDSDAALGAAGQTWLGQKVVTTFINPAYVLLYLKRIGSSAGTLTVELQTDSAGVPSGSATFTSSAMAFNGLSTSYAWVKFPFPANSVGIMSNPHHIVLKSSGYTYAAGVTEVDWGFDASASTYATPNGFKKWNGAAWSAYAGTAGDAIFRQVTQIDPSFTSVSGELARVVISSRSKPTGPSARLLTVFPSGVNDYIGHVSLQDSAAGGLMLAVANVGFLKNTTDVIDAYWTTVVQ